MEKQELCCKRCGYKWVTRPSKGTKVEQCPNKTCRARDWNLDEPRPLPAVRKVSDEKQKDFMKWWSRIIVRHGFESKDQAAYDRVYTLMHILANHPEALARERFTTKDVNLVLRRVELVKDMMDEVK